MELPDIELVSAEVHAAWMESKRAQGVTTRKAEDGEELMAPYATLSEKAKELDRGTVRAVYSAIFTAQAETAQPARMREFLQPFDDPATGALFAEACELGGAAAQPASATSVEELMDVVYQLTATVAAAAQGDPHPSIIEGYASVRALASSMAQPSSQAAPPDVSRMRETLNMVAIGLRTGKIKAASVEMLLSDGPKVVSVLSLVELALGQPLPPAPPTTGEKP